MNPVIIGDATLATADKGRRVFDMMLEHLIAVVQSMVLE